MRLRIHRNRRLRAEYEHEHPDGQQCGYRRVGGEPAEAGRDYQRTGTGDEHRNPIPGLNHCGAGPLLIGREDFNPVRVDHDVLAGGQERNQNRQRRHPRNVELRVASTERERRRD